MKAEFFNHGEQAALFREDCLARMAAMPAESVDMIFADPPYFLSSGGITCQAGKMVSVNKGEWDNSVSAASMHAFNAAWLKECKRILTPNGTLWVSGTMHNIYSVGFALQELGYKILNEIAWHKVNPSPHLACRYFTHAHETILWARKSEKAKHYFDYAAMKEQNGGKQMQSVWYITPPKQQEKRYGKHPTQKPEALLERMIEASTVAGQVVFDPFCGSGTTGVAAIRLGRKFIGCDLELEYLEKAKQRMQDVLHLRAEVC
jgi:site-specific DNA-methyltransferase (adenine-specific)